MKAFSDELDTQRVPLDDGQWVDLKAELSMGDLQTLQREVLHLNFTNEGIPNRAQRRRAQQSGDAPMTAEYNPNNVLLLHLAIVDWSFQKDNSKVPITLANVARLRPGIATLLIRAVEESMNQVPLEAVLGRTSTITNSSKAE